LTFPFHSSEEIKEILHYASPNFPLGKVPERYRNLVSRINKNPLTLSKIKDTVEKVEEFGKRTRNLVSTIKTNKD